MPVDRVFRRPHSSKHRAARSQRSTPRISGKVIRIIGLSAVLGLLAAALILTKPNFSLPSISQLQCSTDSAGECPSEVIEALQPFKGAQLLFSPLENELESRLRPVGYFLNSYVRVLPDTLRIEASSLDILFYLEANEQSLAITTTGASLKTPLQQDPLLLHLSSTDQVTGELLAKTSRVPDWLMHTVQGLHDFFSATSYQPEKIVLRSPFELELELVGLPHPILINPQESDLNLLRLSTILKSGLYSEVASPSARLDVRFRLPVLRS